MCVECVGYLLEELRDPKNVAAFKKDVESSNIFIGSLIFVQVHVNKIVGDEALLVYISGVSILRAGLRQVLQSGVCFVMLVNLQQDLPDCSQGCGITLPRLTPHSHHITHLTSHHLTSPHLAHQELAEEVQKVVEPLRDQLDAVVVFPSMPEVMRLNKVGSFTMQNLGQSKSVVSDFMKKKKKVRYVCVCVYVCLLCWKGLRGLPFSVGLQNQLGTSFVACT